MGLCPLGELSVTSRFIIVASKTGFPWGEGMTKTFALMPNERTTAIFRFNNFIFTMTG